MSSFDRELKEELEKLKKKKEKDTVTPESSKAKSFDAQLELELEHYRKYGTNTEEGRKTYLPSSLNGYTTSNPRSFVTESIVSKGSKNTFDSILEAREKDKEIGPVKTAKNLENLLSVYNSKDFQEKSGYVSTKSDGFWDKLSSKYGMGYTDLQYEYINNQNGIRDEISQKAMSWGRDTGQTTSSYEEKALDFMTAEEIAVYNYYYQTEGKDKAQEFLDVLAETLSARKAGKTFTNMEGKTGLEILYGIPAGAEQFRQGVKNLGNLITGKDDYIPQTATQILTGMVREDLSDNGFNVLGNSAGQMAFDALSTGTNMVPSIAVGAVNPAAGAILMGTSAAGNAYQQDLNEGNDKGEARLYAITNGTLEAMLQYALGGIGKLGGMSTTIKQAVSGVQNGAMRFALEYAGKIGSEAFEEGLQEVLDPIVKNIIHGTNENIDWEEVAYSSLLGAVMGAGFGASEVTQEHRSNDELAVVKKEVENRISEMEKDGKKLTSKEKREIEAQVEEALDRGEISLDTIEEVLGGDDFAALQDTVTKENEALAELAELYEGDELKTHAESLLKDSKRSELQQKLHESVFEKAKGSRLGESYRYLNKYQADLTKYSEKEQAIVKKAMDSGVLNDSRKTHEFVDFVAKVSSYSGIDFDFTSNQKLKETGFVFDGNTTNGFYDPKTNKVVINSQAKKYLHSLVGHEVTHALEGSGLYESIENIAFEYAKQTKEYKTRLKAAHDMYSGKEGYTGQEGLAKIKKEAVADMIGDYLFTDSKFVSHLSVSNPNVFRRIYNEVKHLWKLATAGSQQAKQLEQLKYTFEKALREKGKDSATAEGDVRLSVAETTDGRSVAVVENDILSNIDTSKWDKETKKAAQKAASNELKKFADGFVINGVEYIDSKKTRAEYTKSDYSEALAKHDPEAYLDKMRAASVVDDVVRVATDWTKDGKLKYERKDFVDFVRGKTLIKSGDRTYRAVVLAGITKDGKTIFYDVEDVYPDSFEIKESESYTTVSTDKLPNSILKDSDTDTVTQNGKNVKYSLSPQQEEYFKDSVVRDENGNLKVMYHGTSRGGHTMFDPYGKAKYGLFGLGSYFTDNKAVAESYTKKGKGTSPQVYETYLNITNPMDMDAAADPKQWQKALPEAHFPESGTNEQFYRAMEEYFEDNEYVRWEAEEAAMDAIMGMGYDGITHIGGGRFNKADDTRHRVYIAFQPEQIKDVGNQKPTSDPDIRYSLSDDSEGNRLTKAQQEYFRSSKMRDENGNLKVMYHGSQNGGFHVFDPNYSDDSASLFFVDRNSVAESYSGTSETYAAQSFKTAEDFNRFFAGIGAEEYEVKEADGKFHLYEDGDVVAESDTAEGIYEEFRDWSGKGYGNVNYKVYLDLVNPFIVDAKGAEWNGLPNIQGEDAKYEYIKLLSYNPDNNTYTIEYAMTGDPAPQTKDVVLFADFDDGVSTQLENLGLGEELRDVPAKPNTTRDYADYARKNGYDGVILKNIVDVGGYGGDYAPATVAIAFDSSQVKSVANQNPTTNKDIRFSLSEAVEKTKDLVALHNLTADKLTKSLELGGLPMPSLAITKADIPHSNFGDITLIFDRKTIDPKANKKNKVYSADAWTPVFPRVEYEADSNVGNKISRRLRDLDGRIAGFFQQDLRRLQYGFDDYLNRQGGEEGLIQYAMENYGLKAAYLEEQGQHIEEITKQEEVAKEYNPKAADKYQKILEILGVTTAEEIRSVNLKDARDNHGAELDAVYPGVTQSAMRMARVFNAVSAYLENKDSGPVYNTVTDGNATKMAVDKALDVEGFEAWTRNLFAGIVKDSGIYNNKELFTPSGNRRTFKQTHIPVTLENIVKAMAGQNNGNSKNVSGFNGIKTLRAATAETFKSVDEMHQRKDRLQNLSQEEVDAIHDALQSRLFEIMQTIDNEGKQSSERNPYIRLDSIGETLTEIGESGKYNVADIQKTFRQYGKEIGDDTALAVKQLLYDVTQMPVNIFEAKPQRVVGFDEAKVFVIPNNVDTKLKQELLNRGYNIAEYDPNVDGDRQRVVNQFEELKFSLSDTGDKKYGDLHLTSEEVRYNPEGRKSKFDLPIRQDIAPVRKEAKSSVLYSMRDGKNGWGEVYGTAQEALNDAVQYVSRELYDAFNKEVDNTPQNTPLARGSMPITDALIAVQEDVRQQAITPMQGAQLLSEAYKQGGAEALNQMVNPRNGNLYPQYLEKAKQYETVAPDESPRYSIEEMFPDEVPAEQELRDLLVQQEDMEGKMLEAVGLEDFDTFNQLNAEYTQMMDRISVLEAEGKARDAERIGSLEDADAPPEMSVTRDGLDSDNDVPDPMRGRLRDTEDFKSARPFMAERPEVKPFFQEAASAMLGDVGETIRGERLYSEEAFMREGNEAAWTGVSRQTTADIAELRDNYGYSYNPIETALKAIIEDRVTERHLAAKNIEFMLNDRLLNGYTDMWGEPLPANQEYIQLAWEMSANDSRRDSFDSYMESVEVNLPPEAIGPVAEKVYKAEPIKQKQDIGPVKEKYEAITPKKQGTADGDTAPLFDTTARKGVPEGQMAFMQDAGAPQTITRKELHANIVDNIKARFAENGFDFDKVLKNAKNLSTFSTVDNTPQRVMEKSLGYKEGGILADITVNQVAMNESKGIQWLNSFTDRKHGMLARLSKQYNIKPGSKASAAAQMYAEGFYVGKNDEIIRYGDAELAADFPNPEKQAQIKGLARDPRIRKIYDATLKAINKSRARNAYPEIPRLDNYFLHFRAMNDTFSRIGLPFNPNDIRAKDLPTDLNGVTADLKPGQPFFASAMHREGKRTDFDLLGGLEQYLASAKNQIYHIDDIQNLRALRNYVADTYGQANGLSDLDSMSEEEAQERIKEVYGSHLSTFAKFLNEEANVLAGKTALIDRGVEGIIGRRGITFLNTVNQQVGKNMVGFNVSSSMTNFLPVVQAFAKTNKFDFVKSMAQTTASKLKSIVGISDSFLENNPTIIRRKGAERFHKLPYEKVSDAGYVLMSAVDNISTEIIVRAKYNELTRKGMSDQQAAFEADKWVSRLMGDRSIGQQPQLYNSKMLGLLTKFQLEVRNQLDSQFYDTIQEAKVSSEYIENRLLRNAKTAAKVGSTFFQLAVLQHVFGKAFESVAGYNPAFDIIEAIMAAFGWDDDEEDEDTVLDNIEEGFMVLLEDLPYTSTFTGGRIPIASALPIKQFVTGKDQYGNEKSRWETLAEAAPYYVAPGGYGQLKKTVAGLKMFSDDHPVAGSYTDSGNLRFPVEDTLANRAQAAVFGQWASSNAGDYIDNKWSALKPEQIQEFADAGMSIQDYRKYREGLSKLTKQADKVSYINGLDLTEKQKNVLKSYLFDEVKYAEENPEKYAFLEKEGIGYLGYKQLDEDTQSAWSWAFNHQDEYQFYKENGVMPGDYSTYYIPMLDFEDEDSKAYQWAFDNPEKATFGKVFQDGVTEYRRYTSALSAIKADKDESGKTISGSRKNKVIDYVNSLNIDDGLKMILFKSEYNADDTYNYEIIDYLNNSGLSFDDILTILRELGFDVTDDGTITW